MNPLTQAAAAVTALGIIGGGVITLEARHAPMSVVDDIASRNILDLVKDAREAGAPEWMCDGLEEEIVKFCGRNPGHYLCRPDTIRDIKARAGCDKFDTP